jgi:eukaryotic-like serine/threonine-protein kinase
MRSGHLVYARDGMLGAIGFDLERLTATTDPVTVLRDVFTKPSGAANYAVSGDGTLIYVPGSRKGLARHRLVWVGRDGSELVLPIEPRLYYQPRLSPKGDRIALTIFDGSNDIWVEDLSRGTSTRITFDPDQETDPLWSPDGRTLVFSSDRGDGVPSLYAKPADGSGRERRLDAAVHPRQPESFSPDGRQLVLSERHPETGLDLLLLSLETGSERKLVATAANESEGRLSPDGSFLAYRSDESGRSELYVRPFPDVEAGRWQVTTEGGEKAVWARDGQELFYVNAVGHVAVVSFRARPAVSIGTPAELIDRDYVADTLGPTFDVAVDGRRLLMLKREGGDDAEAILVLNWLEELERLALLAR